MLINVSAILMNAIAVHCKKGDIAMKVLIADDDDYTREGLVEAIDWESFGVNEVLQVEDGAMALRIATAQRPEIVITDIRMPKLNGIEFAERFVAVCPDSKLLFMSGYMDVAYLKSAIQLSAVDYVEKPIKLPEMENAIQKTVHYIAERKAQHVLLDQKMDLERVKLANALRTQSQPADELRCKAQEIGYPVHASYVCLIVTQFNKEILFDAVNIQNYWEQHNLATIAEQLDYDRLLLVVALPRPDEEIVRLLAETLCREYSGLRIAAGQVVAGLEEVSRSFREAALAMEHVFFKPDLCYLTYDPVNYAPQGLRSDIYPEFYQLLKQEPDGLIDWMETFCNRVLVEGVQARERVLSMCVTFANALFKERNGVLIRRGKMVQIQDVEKQLNECRTMLEVKDHMLELCHAYQEEFTRVSPYSGLIRNVMNYISDHCSDVDLDVREIADHVHLSTAHLGVLFKQETGTTIKQYLNDYRLELAKRLILEEHFKMIDISKMSGYASAGYFAKVFKAATGVTPVEYRKKFSQ